MQIIRQNVWLFLFNLIYVGIFTAYYVSIENYEFLWYVGVISAFMILIGSTLRVTKFPSILLWMLSMWGFVHMAGGGVQINGATLYALEIIPIVGQGDAFILKFDQVVHFYGFFVATFVIFYLLSRFVGVKRGLKTLLLVSVLSSIGLGAINEIVEFIAVLALPENGVGGYYNTSIDLVFNVLGAVTASFILYKRKKVIPDRQNIN